MSEPVFFATSAEFRHWLQSYGRRETELVVGFWKVGSGQPSMTWPESVDEALCFGWIDGVRRRIDDRAYQIRFTPRKRTSIWSAVNIAKVELLRRAGLMSAAGLEAFAHRTDQRSAVYAYEQRQHPELTEIETRQFMRSQVAWTYFEACPPSYRKPILYWIISAKKLSTRQRRLEQLIAACSKQERLLK
jgi:uncharacterized protein YdeI (YjbR/CyaY-like superfamily)